MPIPNPIEVGDVTGANVVVTMPPPLALTRFNLRGLASEPRTDTLNGVEHLVVPVIALVEGVVWPSNAPGPELALASEFGSVAEGWDGRPVVVGHPIRNGVQVPANTPDVWENDVIGQLFNTTVEDGKLKTEAWINLETIAEMDSDIQDLISSIQDGVIVEVSTGLFANVDPRPGVFEGEEFIGTWTNVVPDHLAILPVGQVGACSVADGCGTNRMNCAGCEGICNMPPALSLESLDLDRTAEQNYCDAFDTALTPDERTVARLAAYEILSDETSLWSRLTRMFRSNAMSDLDRRMALDAALASTGLEFFWINAVMEDTFVYEKGWDGLMFQQSFRIEEDGTVVLIGAAEKVRPETSFIPVKVEIELNEESEDMEKEARVSALISNAATRLSEEDREWLMSLEDARLEAMEPVEAETPEPDPDPEPESEEEPDKTHTVESFLSEAPADIREVLTDGMKLRREKKENLVARIRQNERNKFSEEDLHGMDMPMLEKTAELSGIDDYSGAGGPRFQEESKFAPAPPKLYQKKEE